MSAEEIQTVRESLKNEAVNIPIMAARQNQKLVVFY
jgi:hypothetical protein